MLAIRPQMAYDLDAEQGRQPPPPLLALGQPRSPSRRLEPVWMKTADGARSDSRQVQFDPSQIVYHPHREFRPLGSHPRPAHWQAIREQALQRDGHQCRTCSARAGDRYEGWGTVYLEVHHRHYQNWGEEHLDDVTVLCQRCHRVITDDFMRSRDQARTYRPHESAVAMPVALPTNDAGALPIQVVVTTRIESLPSGG